MENFIFEVIWPDFLEIYNCIYSISAKMSQTDSLESFLETSTKHKEIEAERLFKLFNRLSETNRVYMPFYEKLIGNESNENIKSQLNNFTYIHVLMMSFSNILRTLFIIYKNSIEKENLNLALETIYSSSGTIFYLSSEIIKILNKAIGGNHG